MARVPSRGTDQFVLRFPEGMRERVRLAAEANGRSMNAEILTRLEEYEALNLSGETLSTFVERLQAERERLQRELAESEHDRRMYANDLGQVSRGKLTAYGSVSLPDGLRARIETAAHQHGRDLEMEALLALEVAFPPPPPHSALHDFLDEWMDGIAAAKESDKRAMVFQANQALEKAGMGKYAIWLERRGDGESAVYFGTKRLREERGEKP